MIRLSGVTKRYRRAPMPSLNGCSFEVRRGALTALVGSNGAGKTTLLRALLNLTDIDSGDMVRDDTPAALAGPTTSYLPERFRPPPQLTPRDFLCALADLAAVDLAEAVATRGRNLAALAAEFDLETEALDRPHRRLSKGMTQKVGLMAAFVGTPELVILDEPMSGLDPRARVAARRALRARIDRGTTVLMSSHVLTDVAELADAVVVLEQGEVRFDGTPAALRDEYNAPDLETAYLSCLAAPLSTVQLEN